MSFACVKLIVWNDANVTKTDWQWKWAAIGEQPSWRQDVGYFMRTKFRLDLLHSTSLVFWWHHKLDLRKELDKECVHPSTWMMFPTNERAPRIVRNQWQRVNLITWSIISVATPPGRKHKQSDEIIWLSRLITITQLSWSLQDLQLMANQRTSTL